MDSEAQCIGMQTVKIPVTPRTLEVFVMITSSNSFPKSIRAESSVQRDLHRGRLANTSYGMLPYHITLAGIVHLVHNLVHSLANCSQEMVKLFACNQWASIVAT